MTDPFAELLGRFTAAVESGDGARLASLFTEDGVYTDTFYGAFVGRAAICDMLENHFCRDGEKFLWDMFDPVSNDRAGYARWLFSYNSIFEGSAGKRVVFDGMSRLEIADGLIRRYDEVFNSGLAFVQLGMAPGRAAKILSRSVEALRRRPEAARHLAGE